MEQANDMTILPEIIFILCINSIVEELFIPPRIFYQHFLRYSADNFILRYICVNIEDDIL